MSVLDVRVYFEYGYHHVSSVYALLVNLVSVHFAMYAARFDFVYRNSVSISFVVVVHVCVPVCEHFMVPGQGHRDKRCTP